MPDIDLPLEPGEGEILARFAWLEDHFDKDGHPTWNLFRPVREKDRPDTPYETSVFRVDGYSPEKIWNLGRERVREGITGRADLRVAVVVEEQLTLHPDPPPDRHVGIRGWDEGKGKLAKGRRKAMAAKLASVAEPFRLPLVTSASTTSPLD